MTMCYPSTTDWSCVGSEADVAELDPIVKERSEMLAWSSLARLTGFRLALCPTTVRPCATRCNPGIWTTASVSGWDGYSPYISNGVWYNACGCRPSSCSCTTIQEIVLPDPEVSGPVVVTINGATLDPSAYRVDNGNRLVRQDGQAWPMCQDMNAPVTAPRTFEPVTLSWPTGERVELSRQGDVVTAVVHTRQTNSRMLVTDYPIPEDFQPRGADISLSLRADARNPDWWLNVTEDEFSTDTYIGPMGGFGTVGPYSPSVATFQWLAEPATVEGQDNTFTVSYYAGLAPDAALNYAAGLLAGEWYKACQGRECRLPSTATDIVRQGVTFRIPTFDQGTSGILEVDHIVANYNPYHLKTPSRVVSVDSLRGRKRTA